MKVGDIIRTSHLEHRPSLTSRLTYRAPKGQQFVLAVLGVEPRDGSEPLDATAALQSLGWTPPPEEHNEEP